MAKFCMKCGQPLAPDSRFCQACGTAVPQEQPQQRNRAAAEPAPTVPIPPQPPVPMPQAAQTPPAAPGLPPFPPPAFAVPCVPDQGLVQKFFNYKSGPENEW